MCVTCFVTLPHLHKCYNLEFYLLLSSVLIVCEPKLHELFV